MFNKMSRKNTFWNKIKCYVTLHTVLVMFSHVFPAVCKIQCFHTWDSKREGAERILEEVWSSASVMVLLSCAGLKRIWRHLMLRQCARRTIVVWHQSTARATESRWLPLIYIMTAPRAFESLSLYFDVIRWSSVWCCSKSNTPIHFALCWNYKALTSPHHLLGKIK